MNSKSRGIKHYKIRKRSIPHRSVPSKPNIVFQTTADMIVTEVSKFYQIAANYDAMYNYIKTRKINVLYWGITNYAKMYDTRYTFERDGQTINFSVYTSYVDYLNQVGKLLFDCYARSNKINASSGDPDYGEYKTISTTYGQLNMFRWAITNKVLDFVMAFYVEIEKDYAIRYKNRKRIKGKKNELSVTSDTRIISENSDITDTLSAWTESDKLMKD